MVKSNESTNLSELDNLLEQSNRKYNTKQDIKEELDFELIEHIRTTYSMEENEKGVIISLPEYVFASTLKKLLKEKNIKVKDSQKIFGITPKTLSRYINGWEYPNRKIIAKIANVLNVQMSYLLGTTNITSFSAQEINKATGLSQDAICSLYKLYHKVEEFKEIDDNILPCEDNKEFLEIFSLFIADYSNFCDFLTYIKIYVTAKQEINTLDNNKEKSLNYEQEKEDLNDKLLRN